MDKTKKAPGGASQNSYCEDSESFAAMQRIKKFFLDGEKGTASDINRECFTGDSRKRISDLRKMGWKICDCIVRGRHKLYWLDHEQRTQILTESYPN